MEDLKEYIKKSLSPKNEMEFIDNEMITMSKVNNMKQDGIGFCKFLPDNINLLEYIKIDNGYMIKKCLKNLEWLNYDNSFTFSKTSEPLYRRLLPPPIETLDHTLIIECIMKASDSMNKSYIEYGVRDGDSINRLLKNVKCAYGVDIIIKESVNKSVKLYEMRTDDFSKEILPEINFDYAFIDADHKFESAYNDFNEIYKYINKGGYIFLHDTYPCDESYLTPGGCNDCYKTPIRIKKEIKMRPGIEILTLPLNPGLTIVRKVM